MRRTVKYQGTIFIIKWAKYLQILLMLARQVSQPTYVITIKYTLILGTLVPAIQQWLLPGLVHPKILRNKTLKGYQLTNSQIHFLRVYNTLG